MSRISVFFLLTIVSAGSTLTLAAPQGMTPGNWKFDVSYDLVGIPQTFPGYTIQQCLDDGTPFPTISRPGHECQMQMQGRFGRTYTWMVNCSNDWEMVQGMGRIHYRREEAKGDVHLQILNPHNPPQMMVFHMEGHYLGPCVE